MGRAIEAGVCAMLHLLQAIPVSGEWRSTRERIATPLTKDLKFKLWAFCEYLEEMRCVTSDSGKVENTTYNTCSDNVMVTCMRLYVKNSRTYMYPSRLRKTCHLATIPQLSQIWTRIGGCGREIVLLEIFDFSPSLPIIPPEVKGLLGPVFWLQLPYGCFPYHPCMVPTFTIKINQI